MLFDLVEEFNRRFDVVIVDGLFAFYDPKLNTLYDKRLFIKISKRSFFIRKVADNRWGYIPTWFVDHIWKSFLKFGSEKHIKG